MMEIDNSFFSHPDKIYNDHILHIAESFDDEHHKVVALYHDLGKLSQAFQTYITLQQEPNENSEAFEKRRNRLKTTHTLESAYLYFCNEENRDNYFLANFFAILRHHSDLPNITQLINDYLAVLDNYIKDRLPVIEDIASKSNIDFKDAISEFMDFFDELADEKNYQNLDNFFLFKKRYSRLILADKFEAIFSRPYQNLECFSNEQIDKYLGSIQRLIEQKQKDNPNEYRTKARETIFRNFNDDTNIYLIKAPTGVGKTIIALELAFKIAKTHLKRRIITAIPFTSIIDQTHSIYEEILDERVLKYHHLTKYQQNDEDEKEQFSQKVFLADIWHEHFIVTTFNQLLYTLFSNHNSDNVRLETFRDSVIIVDEVQNIPRALLKHISRIFEMFANRYNIHFIIMSATMPKLETILPNAKFLSKDWFYSDKKSRYKLCYDKTITDFESLASRIDAHNNQSVICVVNTIEKAKMLYSKIDGEKYLLTTHQIPKHRKEIIDEIKQAITSQKPVKLISTQLIEAGVDFDFDVGYREFAPFGSIIQMAGRVNREAKKDVANVTIFDFLELEKSNDKLKKLPYHAIDLQENDIKAKLQFPLEEIALLSEMESYFEVVQKQTSVVELEKYMQNLEFKTLFNKLNEHFMPKQPWKVSLFIEQKENHFKEFMQMRQAEFDKYKNKFEALNRVKELEKDLGLYTISINEKLIAKLMDNPNYLLGRVILPYGSLHYKKKEGFNQELTRIEEAFD